MPEIANSSFYMVQTDDNGKTSSAAGGDVAQPVCRPTPNINEAKAEYNESFYFVDDGSDSQNVDGTEPTSVEATADTEIEEEQPQQEDESKNDKETDVKEAVIEAPLPVQPSSSLNDPDSLLTSIRVVIGASRQTVICLFHYKSTFCHMSARTTILWSPSSFTRISPSFEQTFYV